MPLHVHAWGPDEAPRVVCLHGVRGHGRVFRGLAERLDSFRVVAPDLRGHGHSSWEPPWTLEHHVEDVLELLGAEPPFALVGHSFGGRLVMELRAAAPAVVSRAVLLDPAIWVPPPVALHVAERERAERIFTTADEAIELRYRTSRLLSTPRGLLEQEMEDHLVAGGDGYRYRYAQSAVVAALGELARTPPGQSALRVPTLLVRGAETDVVPRDLVDWYREIGEPLEVVEVPGGHNVLWDAFDETTAAVVRFLEDARA